MPDSDISALLRKIEHRPFPLPEGPWIMQQTWSKLLFAHWPVSADSLRDLIPPALEIDTFDNTAWIGVVPFAMRKVFPRSTFEVPWLSNFLELNVRTYVKRDGIPGVYFFSLDCSNFIAVFAARTFYHLPYFNATMTMQLSADKVGYSSRRSDDAIARSASLRFAESTSAAVSLSTKTARRLNEAGSGDPQRTAGAVPALFEASYRPTGEVYFSRKGTLEHFLTERYCLYTVDSDRNYYRGMIHHDAWPLQPAEAEFRKNDMTRSTIGITLPAGFEPILHYSEDLLTAEWPLQLISRR